MSSENVVLAKTNKCTTDISEPSNTSSIEVTSFVLKGSLYALTSLQLQTTNLENLGEHLKLKIQQAPKFFENSPIVIDLSKLTKEHIPDFEKLLACLRNNRLMPVGIRKSPNNEVNKAAIACNLAILAENKSASANSKKNKKDNTESLDLEYPNTVQDISVPVSKVVTTPIRSGQQVYARGGDLIVLAPVSHGAEILADGSIHVYGPLRGRALAGVMNNQAAHIFCQSLEAELVSIAGAYQVSEYLRDTHWQQGAHIYLQKNNLQIEKI